MSQGSPRITVRLSDSLLAAIDHVVGKNNSRPHATEHMTITSFVIKACVEKLAHMERSNRKKSRLGISPGMHAVDTCGCDICRVKREGSEAVTLAEREVI